MSLADTTSKPAFVTLSPDRAKPIRLLTVWDTPSVVNRESVEQRARVRNRPRLTIAYEHRGVAPNAFAVNRVKAIEQLGKAVVVPVWVEWAAASSFAANSVTFGAAITTLKHKVGGWIHVTQGSNACFRKITSVVSPTINLSSAGADFEPVGFDWNLFTAGARVYPCILGLRGENRYQFVQTMADRMETPVVVEEL